MNAGGYLKGISQICTNTHEWMNETDENVIKVSHLKGFLNCTLINE